MNSECHLKAVLFDLDGVLVDTAKFHTTAWANLVQSLGYPVPDDLDEKVKGISRMASLRIALGEHAAKYSEEELALLATKKNDHYMEAVKTISPKDCFPGVRELFADLKKNGIKIVLGSASKNAKPVLECLEIGVHFDAVADGFAYKHGKPNPDVFLSGARMVSAAPAECIVVEDAAAGIMAGLDGGFVTVGMGNYESLKHAHHFISSLTEINATVLRNIHTTWRSSAWSVVRNNVQPNHESSLHTLFCTGNGRLGIRGTIGALPACSGIYMAGFYDTFRCPPQNTEEGDPFMRYWSNERLAKEEQVEATLINCPDFLSIQFSVDGEAVDFSTGTLHRFERKLDMQCGLFTICAHWKSPQGKELNYVERRFADRVNTRRVVVQYEIEPLNFNGTLSVTYGINGKVANQSEQGPKRLFDVVSAQALGSHGVSMVVQGKTRGLTAAFASAVQVVDQPNEQSIDTGSLSVNRTLAVAVKQDAIIHINHVAAVALSRHDAEPQKTVEMSLKAAVNIETVRIAHTAAWRKLWQSCDIAIEGDDDNQREIRYRIYHLLITADQDDPKVSIAARLKTVRPE